MRNDRRKDWQLQKVNQSRNDQKDYLFRTQNLGLRMNKQAYSSMKCLHYCITHFEAPFSIKSDPK